MWRKGLVIPMLTCLPCLMLPLPVALMVVCVGVYAKTVFSRCTHKMPTFRVPTLRAAQGSALDWPVPVYPGKTHVLLVKMVLLLNVKL